MVRNWVLLASIAFVPWADVCSEVTSVITPSRPEFPMLAWSCVGSFMLSH